MYLTLQVWCGWQSREAANKDFKKEVWGVTIKPSGLASEFKNLPAAEWPDAIVRTRKLWLETAETQLAISVGHASAPETGAVHPLKSAPSYLPRRRRETCP